MGPYARVAVPLPIHRTFHYSIPDRLRAWVRPGVRCVVPFGKTRVAGFVVALDEEAALARLKPLIEVLDPEPCLPQDLLTLGLWLASYYHHSPGETLASLLPPASRAESAPCYRAVGPASEHFLLESPSMRLWAAARSRGRLLAASVRQADLPALEALLERGLLVREWMVEPPPTPKGIETFALSPDAPTGGALTARAPRQAEILEALSPGPVAASELHARGISRDALSRALAKGWVTRRVDEARAADPSSVSFDGGEEEFLLSDAQEAALVEIVRAFDSGEYRSLLLQGVTGSGKTEVYIRAAQEARRRGLGAIILVPEISLTPQLLGRFLGRFQGELAVLHSGLGERERRLQWEKVRRGEAPIAVGARSAVFAPVPRLGLIVVDEEHESSYKQEEGLRYHAKHAALMRARMSSAVAILGSATPDVETHWGVLCGRHRRLTLPCRVLDAKPPEIRIVDLRQEEGRRRSRRLLSEPLRGAVEKALARGEQALLFLNRRGFSPALICTACGEAVHCPSCSVSLTLHRGREGSESHLLCHYCALHRPVPETCPTCGAWGLSPAGVGTQRLVEAAQLAWPGGRIVRLDRDAAQEAGGAGLLSAFHRGEADILVGTQMVAKGHHFPRLTVVGVVDADLSLNFPEFRAGERTFQVLTQVAGRAGRGERPGVVYIQTRNPHHPVFDAVVRGDYEEFASLELEARREAGFPPFRRLALFRISAAGQGEGRRAAHALASRAREVAASFRVEILGPTPAPVERARGRYRFQVLLRAPGPEPGPVQAVVRMLLAGRTTSGDQVRVQVDVDPVSLL